MPGRCSSGRGTTSCSSTRTFTTCPRGTWPSGWRHSHQTGSSSPRHPVICSGGVLRRSSGFPRRRCSHSNTSPPSASSSGRTRRQRRARPSESSVRTLRSWGSARTCCHSSRLRRSHGRGFRRLRATPTDHCASRADRTRPTWPTCRRSNGRPRMWSGIGTITIGSIGSRPVQAPRWKCRAAVRITARSAQRTIFATTTGSGRCR